MKKSPPKKQLPVWISYAAVLVVLILIVVVWIIASGPKKKGGLNKEAIAGIQKFVDSGGVPRGKSRAELEALGVKFPSDYDQKIQQQTGRQGAPMRGQFRGK